MAAWGSSGGSAQASIAGTQPTTYWPWQSSACFLYRDRSLLRFCWTRRPDVLVPGISDQLLIELIIIGTALGVIGVGIVSKLRLDARVRRERERAAATPRLEK